MTRKDTRALWIGSNTEHSILPDPTTGNRRRSEDSLIAGPGLLCRDLAKRPRTFVAARPLG